MNKLISSHPLARNEEALRLLDCKSIDIPQMIAAIEHILQVEGAEGNIGTLVWAIYKSGIWNGERQDLFEKIEATGNCESAQMARMLLGD